MAPSDGFDPRRTREATTRRGDVRRLADGHQWRVLSHRRRHRPDRGIEHAGDDASWTPQGALLVTGFVVLALGLLELLLVYALFGWSNVARIITTVVFGVSLLFSLASVLTRQPGALFAWVTGLVDVIVLVGLWGTPGAAEFFDSGHASSTRAAPPVPRHLAGEPTGQRSSAAPTAIRRTAAASSRTGRTVVAVVRRRRPASRGRRRDAVPSTRPVHDAGDTILRWFADHEDTTA
jgi:hypothetical protein